MAIKAGKTVVTKREAPLTAAERKDLDEYRQMKNSGDAFILYKGKYKKVSKNSLYLLDMITQDM